MFSSRIFWTAATGYLVLAAAAAWGFGHLAGPHLESSGGPSAQILIWEAVLTVAGLGLVLTWGVLRRAAVRLAGITESAAAREAGEPLFSARSAVHVGPWNLESAIASMNHQLGKRHAE